MCRCGAHSTRQEEFTNLSLDLVPGASTEQMLQEYVKVSPTCPRSVTPSPTDMKPQTASVCVCLCVCECVLWFGHQAHNTEPVVFVLFCRRQSWSSGASAEARRQGRVQPLQPCQGEWHCVQHKWSNIRPHWFSNWGRLTLIPNKTHETQLLFFKCLHFLSPLSAHPLIFFISFPTECSSCTWSVFASLHPSV